MASQTKAAEKPTEKKQENIQANITPELAKGVYGNAVRLSITDSEVVLDFAFVIQESPEQKSASIVSRTIMSHDLAKKSAEAILTTLEQHKRDKAKNEPSRN